MLDKDEKFADNILLHTLEAFFYLGTMLNILFVPLWSIKLAEWLSYR